MSTAAIERATPTRLLAARHDWSAALAAGKDGGMIPWFDKLRAMAGSSR